MTPLDRALLLADVAAILIEALRNDAAPKPRLRRPMRCTLCGRERVGCTVKPCKMCGGWMRYDETQQIRD